MKISDRGDLHLRLLHIIHQFGWVTRRQLVSCVPYLTINILRMELDKFQAYLQVVRRGNQYLYSLNQKGSQLVGVPYVPIPADVSELDAIILHHDIWEWCGCPDWQKQTPLPAEIHADTVVPYAYWYAAQQLHLVEVDAGDNAAQILPRLQTYLGLVQRALPENPPPHVYYVVKDLARGRWMKEVLGEETPWFQIVLLK
ncbi:hypothetical protein CN899_25435 [Bacillus thuringiensis]|uniref:Uncharacterized protein n=1 Tax=Bacillus thuringiensis TaxID=1428 RepID=A0A9X7GGV8_BACTU|nr:hypothetical protein [Bacillus thuringiensis]PGH79635.1 hypothetical protein CN899_25435 [Bacillus thuringiensis]